MSFYIQYTDKLPTVDELEKELVKEAVFKNRNISKAAKEIGLSARTVHRRLEEQGLRFKDVVGLTEYK